ncbi:hypothetical protein B0J18DRAFT_462737 [Chaetomium sp. MPI-SDFR-AT-0129]|nr:hypothetical protein B0J18DRAFT_462737 [Chaetomium sp. MPI-SDFR-AT-0129]
MGYGDISLPKRSWQAHYGIPGSVDPQLEIEARVTVAGITIPKVTGSLRDGVVGLRADLFAASGDIKFYIRQKAQVDIDLNLDIKSSGPFKGQYKIMTF